MVLEGVWVYCSVNEEVVIGAHFSGSDHPIAAVERASLDIHFLSPGGGAEKSRIG